MVHLTTEQAAPLNGQASAQDASLVAHSRMDQTLKAEWMKALRSGEYDQVTGQLHNEDGGYCCLGVLCKVMGATFGPAIGAGDDGLPNEYNWVPHISGRILSNKDDDELSSSVCREVGIPDQKILIQMNDGHVPKDGGPEIRPHTFPEIADYIEQNL